MSEYKTPADKTRRSLSALKLMVLGAAMGVGAATALLHLAQADVNRPYNQLNRFAAAFTAVRSDYVKQPKDSDLVGDAINGMLTNLDAHSSYFDPKIYSDMLVQTEGDYAGVGLVVSNVAGDTKVVQPMDGAPAAKAGIKAGDTIQAVDGQAIHGLNLDAVQAKLRGPAGTQVLLTIAREKVKPFTVTLHRAVVDVDPVTWKREGDVGYIKIPSFNDRTNAGVEDAIRHIRAQIGPALKGYVIDLRNDGGGVLDQAIAVSDDFLEGGEIVSTRGRNPQDTTRYDAKPGDLAEGKPVIVLINGGTASASEIVSGALQDHHRARMVGTVSFGKGSVQTIIPLDGGAGGALHITTARYYTPSGHSIQATGIIPDYLVDQAPGAPTSQFLIPESEAMLPHHLDAQDGVPPAAPKVAAEPPPGSHYGDYQLYYALHLLGGTMAENTTGKPPA